MRKKIKIIFFIFFLPFTLFSNVYYGNPNIFIVGKGKWIFEATTPDKKYRISLYRHYMELWDARKNIAIKNFICENPIENVFYFKDKFYFQTQEGFLEWDLFSDAIKIKDNPQKQSLSLSKKEKEEELYYYGFSDNFFYKAQEGVLFLKEKPIAYIVKQEKSTKIEKETEIIFQEKSLVFQNQKIQLPFLLPEEKISGVYHNGIETNFSFYLFYPSLKGFLELLFLSRYLESQEKQTLLSLLEFLPEQKKLFTALGKLFLQQKDYPQAIFYLEKALEKNDKKSFEDLGIAYFYQGQYDKALSLLKNSDSAESLFFQAGCFYFKNQENKAMELYHRLIQRHPDYVKAYNNLAVLYKKRKNLKEAEKILLKGLSRNFHADLFYNLGILYHEQKNFIVAMLCYEKAYQINPLLEEVIEPLYFVYIELGLEEKGLDLLKKSIEKNPQNAISHYNLGLFYSKKKEYALAVFHLQAFVHFTDNASLKTRTLKEIERLLELIRKNN